jgi:hypothetical protein
MCHRVMFFAADDRTDTGEGLVLHRDPTDLHTNSARGICIWILTGRTWLT